MIKNYPVHAFAGWLPAICLGGLLFGGLPASGQNEVHIDIHTERDIGGYTEVQELFGLMTGNMDSRAKPYMRDAKLTGVRSIINWIPSPGTPGLGFKYPDWNDLKTPTFASREESLQWFDGFIAREPVALWNGLLAGLDYLDDSYGETNVCISGNPFLFDGRLERNPAAAQAHVSAYIQALKNTRPPGAASRLKYFQLANEPEQQKHWAGQFHMNQYQAVQSYTRVFNFLYDPISEQHPDVIMIGNCVGHDAAFRLNNVSKAGVDWNIWVKYFVDHVSNPAALHFFNSQTYSVPTLRNLVFASMTQNYGEIRRGVRPRQVITETGAPDNYLNQFVYTADNIFMMLEHPDKYAVRTGFVAADFANHAFFKVVAGELVPQSPYWVLAVLKNLRGRNIQFRAITDTVRVFVSSPSDTLLVAALFNPDWAERQVTLHTGMPDGQVRDIMLRKAVWNSQENNALYAQQGMLPDTVIHLTLEPKSVYSLELSLSEPPGAAEQSRTREYYGDAVNVDMSVPPEIEIALPFLPDSLSGAFLRMGLDRRPSTGVYRIHLNGKEYTIDLGKLPDKLISTYHEMSGFLEIPVDPGDLLEQNRVIPEPLGGYRLLYSSIVLQGFRAPLHRISFRVFGASGPDTIPLEGVTAEVGTKATLTDDSGSASLEGFLEGSYHYRMHRKGFNSASGQILLRSDTLISDTLHGITYKIQIRVNDAVTGLPLADCGVWFDSVEYASGSDGALELSGVEYGYYDIQISRGGYDTLHAEQVEIFSDTVLTFRLRMDAPEVSMTVVDRLTGEPVPRAVIHTGGSVYLTDNNGVKIIPLSAPGLWEYQVEMVDYFLLSDSAYVWSDTSMVVQLLPERANIEFLVSSEGSPLPGVTVELDGSERTTDAGGYAWFGNRPALQSYFCSLTKEGFGMWSDTFFLEVDTTLHVSLQRISGIQGRGAEKIVVYPNPAGESLSILSEFTEARGALYTSDGRCVWGAEIVSGRSVLDVAHLAQGIYTLRIISGNRCFHQKIIIRP